MSDDPESVLFAVMENFSHGKFYKTERNTIMIIINKDRSAQIPQSERHIGFEKDHLVEKRLIYIVDSTIKDFTFKLDIENSSDIVSLTPLAEGVASLIAFGLSKNGETFPTGKLLQWDITQDVLGTGGVIVAQLRAFDQDGTHVWHSEKMEFTAGDSVHAVKDASDKATLTEFEQIEARVEKALASMDALHGDVTEKYGEITALGDRYTQAMESVESIEQEANEHYVNQSNPHQVTAEQVGAYSKTELNPFVSGNFGNGNTKHAAGFVSGSKNEVGTRGYRILAYTGVHGGTGTYTLDGDSAEYAKLKAVIDAESGLKVTLMNVMNADSFSTVTGAAFTGGKIVLSVSNIYTNSDKTPYNANTNYVTPGKYFDGYPELGYSIKQRENGNASFAKQACLFICGHGELGTFEWFGDGAAFGEENKAQGLGAFAAGKGNEACGKYSSAIGKDNKAGYADAVFGRNNDASNAQNCFVAGEGNVVDGMGFYHAVFGEGNKVSGGSHKLVAGAYNKAKSMNAVEIGGGGSNARHNVFEVDKAGFLAPNETCLAGQEVFNSTVYLGTEARKNYITDKDTQVFEAFGGVSATGSYGPYVGITAPLISTLAEGWYLLVADIANYLDGWNPTIRSYCRTASGTESAGGNYIKKKPLAVGSYKLLFPIYVTNDKGYDRIGFYAEKNKRNIEINAVQLFKFYAMDSRAISQHDYSLISYYSPYTSVDLQNASQMNIGFEAPNTEEYGYIVCKDNDTGAWYLAPVDENPTGKSYPGLVYTSGTLMENVMRDVEDTARQVSGKLDRYGDDLVWITDSYSLYAVSKGSQVMLETVDPYSPEFAPFRIPQFDEELRLPVMKDEDGQTGYAISDIEVEKKLGTVDAALEAILAIQNSLIGGNA